MSDAVRSYGGAKSTGPRRRRSGRTARKGGCGCLGVLAGLMLGFVAGLWMTRDTTPVERLIAAEHGFHIVAPDLLNKRAELARAKVWGVIPAALNAPDVPKLLMENQGVPDWALNNIVPGACYVVGNSISQPDSALFLTRMTRIGCLLERISPLAPAVQRDYAGGLNLRVLPDAGLYYAVRGRALVASRSRKAVVDALTLRAEDAMEPGALNAHAQGLDAADLFGNARIDPTPFMPDFVQSVSFAAKIENESISLKTRVALASDLKSEVQGVLKGLVPQTLLTPAPGMIAISLDLGMPLKDLWATVGHLTGQSESMQALWTKWTEPPADGAYPLVPSILALVAPMGPGMRLSLVGVDLNEMLPAPELVMTIDAPANLQERLAALPPVPPDAMPWDSCLRYDSETGRVRLPMMGGPSIEPTAAPYGGALFISSSATAAEAILAGEPRLEPLPSRANLWVRIDPKACADVCGSVMTTLAEIHMLRDQTPEVVREMAAKWSQSAAAVQEIVASAGWQNGEMVLDVSLRTAQ